MYAFSRDGDSVTLTTEYPPGKAELNWSELRELTPHAKSETVRLITTTHPEPATRGCGRRWEYRRQRENTR
ncbi:hypothetical protein QQY66_35135 [Streptomyces sp. DG2A-72]|uniref:hypothetical protein n=1 Tax=Streptomyces sp. DG2A-72 TaxID=3051386 RepID=UPI00265C0DF3|nr:hypothetical protein [Streptomyces sp. DG2A-72]MDO0936694.1 hypothetical protein [Streptomyces sp. DG2A-72]